MSFHWQSLNSSFSFDPRLSYVVYYKGCFCPPHAGHFGQARIVSENVKVIIHQKGGSSRHGVSKEINRKIWKYYIKKLLPSSRIDLVQYESSHKDHTLLTDHPWIKNCDVLIILKGDEFEDKHLEKSQVLYRYKSVIDKLYKHGIKTVFYYTSRNHDLMSASTFITQLLKYKKGKINIKNLYKYLPPLEVNEKQKVIDLLLSCPLKV